ncbi:MAG TPA: 2,3-bisphosphoglycerate-independent phosphoglycerate mutase [Saprospiraceae bacterium]|nr:2,3-bisphosphoglycerate-independent phosphoglycerate mutase [Saprospiraceae bacterium]HMP24264.1 2,3-bisphosphoglycerate-independent phosphoglycerate mutase [Saprospiraceae bacterium]
MNAKRVALIILDGWGHGPKPEVSAIAQANTPFIDSLYQQYPNAELVTFGEAVGLPEGQMGNSEVGHLNIGAGRIVYQELARIHKAIRERELHQNPVLLKALAYAKSNHKPVHLIGLVSDGGVHSHLDHLKALCDIAQAQGITQTYIHAFTDGRDCDPKSGLGFIRQLLEHTQGANAQLASVVGRYYAMDRDKRWERVKQAYDLLVHGKGAPSTNVLTTIRQRYDAGETDEFLKPIVCTHTNGQPVATIQPDDVVIAFNFRTDRLRELTTVLTQQDMKSDGMATLPLHYVTMTRYDESFRNVQVLFEKDNLSNTLGEVLSVAGKTQVRIAETEKYPHVTFFFSGGREEPFEGERRIMIPSPKVATYDRMPEMSAPGVTDAIVKDIEAHQPDFICLNYANADMVGHTGVFEAAVKAAETVDACTRRLVETALAHDYDLIIIADHGNSDYLVNDDGTPNTAHTMNPVPIIYASKNAAGAKVKNGKLGDIAPTILALLGMPAPTEMDGEVLISK